MDAIAHTQVSAVCLITLAALLRAQQKMRDKSLPGRLFTALLWSAEALTLVDYNSALAQMGAPLYALCGEIQTSLEEDTTINPTAAGSVEDAEREALFE